MKSIIIFTVVCNIIFCGCAQEPLKPQEFSDTETQAIKFKLSDFLVENSFLDKEVNRIFESMDDTAIVAQLIMPAVGRLGQKKETIDQHIKDRVIGGVLMLNGTKEEFTSWIKEFESNNKKRGNLPFLYSADAEPSLVNRK